MKLFYDLLKISTINNWEIEYWIVFPSLKSPPVTINYITDVDPKLKDPIHEIINISKQYCFRLIRPLAEIDS
ncbi:hypothetical protein TRFO_38185 [Tritrichomonas foetus]|uniref:Uncharacterized protein n=1 Tax=Tritrichomonas foetus TaxID=1144522 RepID=A0A1J4J933_9EUKA|nr:hypothetical protein TRFO_38185 [Tritrichomonas foetus]|eukprot:OHS95656.1 hypothetical protein TRFO_38185 [Tritrichomonas foetus]